MKKTLSLLMGIMLLATANFTLAQEEADAEKEAWKKVDQMEVTQLQEFLKKFPEGKHAEDAKFDLSLHYRIADIKANKIKNAVVIPLEKLGERWESWVKRRPERGAIGVYRDDSSAGIFRAMGSATVSFDYSGMPITPTGEGSILAIKTAGLKYQYVGNIIFESEKEGTLYFAVIKDKGLVHIHGKGKLTMPDGKEIELK